MSKPENPYAFPLADQSVDEWAAGMDLLDWFAGQFADVAWKNAVNWSHVCPESAKVAAQNAYMLASAMLTERQRIKEESDG